MCHPVEGPNLLELANAIQDLIKSKYLDSARRTFTAAVENKTGKWFEIDLPEKIRRDFSSLAPDDRNFVVKEALFDIAKKSFAVGEFGTRLAFQNGWKFIMRGDR